MPAHWEVKPVYAIASLRNGYPFKADLFESEGDPRKRVIRIRDILGDGDAIYSNENCPSWAEIKDGDILVGMDGDFNVHRWSRGNAQLNQRMCTVFCRTLAKRRSPEFHVIIGVQGFFGCIWTKKWRRGRDLNPRYRFKPVYSLSRRAPSADSDTSPECCDDF